MSRTHLSRAALFLLALALCGGAIADAYGQTPPAVPPSPDPPADSAIPTAPVTVDGNTLFQVRGLTGFTAADRASAIQGRIVAMAADSSFSPDALAVVESDVASQVMAGSKPIVTVYDADARLEGVSRQTLAALHARQISRAITAWRADRSDPAMARALSITALLGGLFALLVFALLWLWRRLDHLLDTRYRQRVETLSAKSRDVVNAEHVWSSLRTAIRFLRTAILVVLTFGLAESVLALFPQTRAIASGLTSWVVEPIATLGKSLVATIPNLLFLGVLFVIVRLILSIVRRTFDAIGQGRIEIHNFDREWAAPTYKLVRLLVVIVALVAGYPYVPGASSDAFKGLSLFFGVLISLGSSSFLANIIAGYALIYRRLFRVGDRVQIGDVKGTVSAVRLQVTHLRTPKNEEVTIPSSVIMNTHVVNYSALVRSRGGLILQATVGIGYETPWRQVEAMLLEAARRTPGAKSDPPPFVWQTALADFAVTYSLLVFTDRPEVMEVTYTDLHRNILDVFNEYGVQIMTPAYRGDPATPKVVPPDQWYPAPARPESSGR